MRRRASRRAACGAQVTMFQPIAPPSAADNQPLIDDVRVDALADRRRDLDAEAEAADEAEAGGPAWRQEGAHRFTVKKWVLLASDLAAPV